MSWWTHLNGIIKIDVPHSFYTEKSLLEYGEWLIKTVRAECDITGSERNVELNAMSLHSNGFIGDGTYSRSEYGDLVIVMNGNFRDREFDETYNETIAFIHKLMEYVHIDNININVFDDYGEHKKHITDLDMGGENDVFIDLDKLQDLENDELFLGRLQKFDEFSKVYCTKERMIEAINLLNLMPHKVFEDVMDSFPLDRHIDWEYRDDYIKTLIEQKRELPELNKDYVERMKKEIEDEKNSNQ